MDWERFRFDYRLDEASMGPLLVQIEAYKEAALNLVLPPHWRNSLDRLNRVRAVHGTTALEGNPLSETQVGQQLEQTEEQPRQQSREQLQVRNAGLAQDWTRKRFGPSKRPLTYGDIMHMHRLNTRGSDEMNNTPGELRTHSVVVGTEALGGVHRGAPPERLNELMHEFVEFINSGRPRSFHPVLRALLAHFFLVTIHPFGDGNGRVSRLVEAGILFQGGYNVFGFYGLSNYFYRNGDQYRILLQKSRRRQPFELGEFVMFGLEGFAGELKGINNFIKTKLNRVIYRNTLAAALGKRVGPRRRVINQREYQLLEHLIGVTEPTDPFAEEPSRRIPVSDLVREPYVRAIYEAVTRRTFSRELIRLAEMGFIKVSGQQPDLTVEIDFNAIGRY